MKPDVLVELKSLRLHGMAGAWADLVEHGGNAGIESSRWLIEHLLQAEGVDRAMRSVSHQMKAAKFPVHRDLAGFDFEVSPVDRKLVTTLATTAFTDGAHNVVLVGGPGTGKTHLATAIGVAGITRQGKRVRSTPRSIWSMRWSRRRRKARRVASPPACCAWIWSSSMSWATCPSARPVGRCCSTCSAVCTSTPA